MPSTEYHPQAGHRAGGLFRNPWPNSEPHALGALLRWVRELEDGLFLPQERFTRASPVS